MDKASLELLTGKESEEEQTAEPEMQFWPYWRARAKEARMKARVRCEAGGFLLFLLSGIILWRYPSFPVDRTTWFCITGAFVVLFLVELCFIAPYQYAKSLAAKHEAEKLTLESNIKSLRRGLDLRDDMARKRRDQLREQVLGHTLEQLKGGLSRDKQEMLSFQAFFKAGGYGLKTVEDVAWVCDEVAKFHPHPFNGLDNCVLPEERLAFLQWGKAHGELSFDRKGEFVTGAELWAREHGRPEAPIGGQLTVWREVLERNLME